MRRREACKIGFAIDLEKDRLLDMMKSSLSCFYEAES